MKKILLIEDSDTFIIFFSNALQKAGYRVEIVKRLPPTPSDPDFQALLARSGEFDAIIWDAEMFMKGVTLMTYDGYIQEFAKVFKGPMIASSSISYCRNRQIEAGCTHELSDKKPEGLIELLKNLQCV